MSKHIKPLNPSDMDYVFYKCVHLLEVAAAKCHMTYEEINVWIFCIIWPLFTLLLLVIIYVQRKSYQSSIATLQALLDSQQFLQQRGNHDAS